MQAMTFLTQHKKLFTRMLYWQNILQIVVIAVVLFMP